jgi:hypothetical protein
MLTLRIQSYFASFGQTFRKNLPIDYKKGNKHTHRNTHALPFRVKDSLLRVTNNLLSLKKVVIGRKLDNCKDKA